MESPLPFIKYVIWIVLTVAITVAYTGPILSILKRDRSESAAVTLTIDRLIKAGERQSYTGTAAYVVPVAGQRKTAEQVSIAGVSVSYTDNGFVPTYQEMKRGETFTIVNRSNRAMRIVIAPIQKPSPAPEITQAVSSGNGAMFTLTMNTVGEFRYFNLNRKEDGGIISVR